MPISASSSAMILLGQVERFAILGICDEFHLHDIAFFSAGCTAMAFTHAIPILIESSLLPPAGLWRLPDRIPARGISQVIVGRAEELRPDLVA